MEIMKFIKKQVIFSVLRAGFNSIYVPLIIILIFYVSIFYAKMAISVPTVLVIRVLLKDFNQAGTMFMHSISVFLEFLVSMNRIQDFLLCEETNLSAIEFKEENNNFSIKIDSSNFFWGFEQNEDIKKIKINKTKLEQLNKDFESYHTSKTFLFHIGLI